MPQPLILYKVIPNTQKAVASAGGFALVALVAPPGGKRVFLLIVTTVTTVMHGMTPAATTVKKAALGRSKSPPLAVKKHLIKSRSALCTSWALLTIFGCDINTLVLSYSPLSTASKRSSSVRSSWTCFARPTLSTNGI